MTHITNRTIQKFGNIKNVNIIPPIITNRESNTLIGYKFKFFKHHTF